MPDGDLASLLSDVDVVVMDLHGPLSEAAAIVKAIRRGGRARTVVCVSSVQTWGRTPAGRRRGGGDEGPPMLREDAFTSRKPTPGFTHMKAVESQVLSLRSETTSVTVLAAGVLYGNGEGPLHSIFKAAWSCAPLGIPAFKDGASNFLPTIHVQHLAHAVAKVIEAPPAQSYVVAVDNSQCTLRDVMQAVGGAMNAGAAVPSLAGEDTDRLLLEDPSVAALQLDLRFDVAEGGLAALGLGDQATCAGGIVENIDEVVAQFLKQRDLRPLRIAVMAPPAAGAEEFSNALANKYRLPRVDGATAVAEFLAAFSAASDAPDDAEAAADGGDGAAESKDGGTELDAHQLLAKEISDSGNAAANVPTPMLAKVVRWKLRTPPCQNQGYVLTGVPATFEAAVAMFSEEGPAAEEAAEPNDADDLAAATGSVDAGIAPTSVVILDAPDEWLRLRAEGVEHEAAPGEAAAGDDAAAGTTFAEQLAAFRGAHDPEKEQTPSSYFEVASKLETLSLSVDSHPRDALLEMIAAYVEKGGKPFNYHPTKEEGEALSKEQADLESRERESKLSAAQSGTAAADARQAEREADHMRRLDEVERREAELLETRSLPLRNYLMAHVMPTLTQGLVDVCKVRPEDPVDYLAEYLFKATR